VKNRLRKHLQDQDEGGSLSRARRQAERIDKRDRVILKNEEERSVFEEVFDRRTLMTLYDLANKGVYSHLNGVVSSGKEARVYWGVTQDGTDIAVKIYLVASSDFKKRAQYVVGDPRFVNFRRDSRGIAELWARKEYTNLSQAFEAGVSVPKPVVYEGNVLTMQFIGKSGVPAPRLIDTDVSKKDYLSVVKETKTLYSRAEIVHSDLSEYNIFKLDNKVYLFDFGSAVSIQHPMAREFLKRDIHNLNHFFERRGVKIIEEETLVNHFSKLQAKNNEPVAAEQ
jgi:RIO kinase 1